MAEESREEQDGIIKDIEASLTQGKYNNQTGYRMTIHPNGLVEITTGELAQYPILGNPHYSCCCCCG